MQDSKFSPIPDPIPFDGADEKSLMFLTTRSTAGTCSLSLDGLFNTLMAMSGIEALVAGNGYWYVAHWNQDRFEWGPWEKRT